MKIIDVHAHLGVWPYPIEHDQLVHLQRLLDKYQIYRCIISSSRAILYDMEAGNREVAEATQQEERLLGLIFVDPNCMEKSLYELQKYSRNPRFVGVKYHPAYVNEPVNAEENQILLDEIDKLGLPLCVHTWGKENNRAVLQVAEKYPDMNIVCFHMGCPDYEILLEKARTMENTFMEIAMTFTEGNRVRRAIEIVGKERVLFGTDSTLLNPAFSFGVVKEAGLSSEEEEYIYYKNAQRIFDVQ